MTDFLNRKKHLSYRTMIVINEKRVLQFQTFFTNVSKHLSKRKRLTQLFKRFKIYFRKH